jgi:hypothetical protein
MVKLYIYTAIITYIFNFAIAGQGDKGGNGGGGWACQKNNSKITKIELFDFFEAENLYGLKIKKYSERTASKFSDVGYFFPLSQYELRISEIDSKLFKELEPYFQYVDKNINLIGQEADLELVHDLKSIIKPNSSWCKNGTIVPQTIINFTDEGSIYFNKQIFNHKEFSITEKAGLILHEVIYAYLREKYGDEDSADARLIVSLIASDLSVALIKSSVLNMLKWKSTTVK